METNCSKCQRPFDNDVIRSRPRRSVCRDCANARNRAYRKVYRQKHGCGVSQKLTVLDRLQVRACKSYFRKFVINMEMGHVEAFVRAVLATDDEHFAIAVKEHPVEVTKWCERDFVAAKDVAREQEEVYVPRCYPLRLGKW